MTSHILAFACGGLLFAAVSFAVCFVREWALKRNHQTEYRDAYRRGYRAGMADGMKRTLRPLAPTC